MTRRAAGFVIKNELACRCLVVAAILAITRVEVRAQSTAFTYQGFLDDGGTPAHGVHHFRAQLYDVAPGGSPIGSTLCVDNVDVVDGVFTAQLDFGQQFVTTSQRYLEIEVPPQAGVAPAPRMIALR